MPDLKGMNVSLLGFGYVCTRITPFCACMRQVTGDDLHGMDFDELREISPHCTRVECKLLLQRIKDVQFAYKVLPTGCGIRLWRINH